MTRRPHQAEGRRFPPRFAGNIDRRPGAALRVLIDSRISGRVRIERLRRGANPLDMIGRMRAQERPFLGRIWCPPFPTRVAVFQQQNTSLDPRRPFGMSWGRILNATRIVDNDHWPKLSKRLEASTAILDFATGARAFSVP